jgi:hypothetical protein
MEQRLIEGSGSYVCHNHAYLFERVGYDASLRDAQAMTQAMTKWFQTTLTF